MAKHVGRTRRAAGTATDTQRATVRLPPEVWEIVERGAAAVNVSRDVFLEELLRREVRRMDRATGRPRWWPRPKQEELDLPMTG